MQLTPPIYGPQQAKGVSNPAFSETMKEGMFPHTILKEKVHFIWISSKSVGP